MNADLLQTIEDTLPGLSKSQRAIGRFICDHYDRAAYMTAARLGTDAGVSESTVVRFAIALGYEGYPELQQALRSFIRTRLTALQRIEITDDRIGSSDILASVLNSDIDKIRGTLENISREDFSRAVEIICGARTIYIAGARTSAALATFLGVNLNLIFENVKQIQTAGGSEIFEQLLHVGPDDVVVVMSFPRYSKRIINAVSYARKSGAEVVAISDSTSSPIAEYSSVLLPARSDMVSFVDSLVAPLSLINALIVAISRRRREALSGIFGKLEGIWHDYDVYDKN